jgi:hypothetical protein
MRRAHAYLLAALAVTAEIRLDCVTAADGAGGPILLTAPPAHRVSIALASGAGQ